MKLFDWRLTTMVPMAFQVAPLTTAVNEPFVAPVPPGPVGGLLLPVLLPPPPPPQARVVRVIRVERVARNFLALRIDPPSGRLPASTHHARNCRQDRQGMGASWRTLSHPQCTIATL